MAKSKRKRGADKKPRRKRSDNPRPPLTALGNRDGETNALPKGAVAAIRSLRHRVPDSIPQPLQDVAHEAMDVVVDVMRGNIPFKEMTPRLSACRILREEICGPIPKTVEHEGNITVTVVTGVPRTPVDPGAEDPKKVLAELLEDS